MGEPQVQPAQVHEGHLRARLHHRVGGGGLTDAGRQLHATAGHGSVSVHRAVLQHRPAVGEVIISHQ